jgi:hypothetical protein
VLARERGDLVAVRPMDGDDLDVLDPARRPRVCRANPAAAD